MKQVEVKTVLIGSQAERKKRRAGAKEPGTSAERVRALQVCEATEAPEAPGKRRNSSDVRLQRRKRLAVCEASWHRGKLNSQRSLEPSGCFEVLQSLQDVLKGQRKVTIPSLKEVGSRCL